MRRVVGITGLNAAGKGVAAEILVKHGYRYYSLPDILRDIASQRNLEPSRDNLRMLGSEIRQKHGPGILARRTAEKILKSSDERIVVESIRSPAEVQELKKLGDFTLIEIYTEPNARFQRAKARGRNESAATLQEFIDTERKEFSSNPNALQLHECLRLAQRKISNDGTLAELESMLAEFI